MEWQAAAAVAERPNAFQTSSYLENSFTDRHRAGSRSWRRSQVSRCPSLAFCERTVASPRPPVGTGRSVIGFVPVSASRRSAADVAALRPIRLPRRASAQPSGSGWRLRRRTRGAGRFAVPAVRRRGSQRCRWLTAADRGRRTGKIRPVVSDARRAQRERALVTISLRSMDREHAMLRPAAWRSITAERLFVYKRIAASLLNC